MPGILLKKNLTRRFHTVKVQSKSLIAMKAVQFQATYQSGRMWSAPVCGSSRYTRTRASAGSCIRVCVRVCLSVCLSVSVCVRPCVSVSAAKWMVTARASYSPCGPVTGAVSRVHTDESVHAAAQFVHSRSAVLPFFCATTATSHYGAFFISSRHPQLIVAAGCAGLHPRRFHLHSPAGRYPDTQNTRR